MGGRGPQAAAEGLPSSSSSGLGAERPCVSGCWRWSTTWTRWALLPPWGLPAGAAGTPGQLTPSLTNPAGPAGSGGRGSGLAAGRATLQGEGGAGTLPQPLRPLASQWTPRGFRPSASLTTEPDPLGSLSSGSSIRSSISAWCSWAWRCGMVGTKFRSAPSLKPHWTTSWPGELESWWAGRLTTTCSSSRERAGGGATSPLGEGPGTRARGGPNGHCSPSQWGRLHRDHRGTGQGVCHVLPELGGCKPGAGVCTGVLDRGCSWLGGGWAGAVARPGV